MINSLLGGGGFPADDCTFFQQPTEPLFTAFPVQGEEEGEVEGESHGRVHHLGHLYEDGPQVSVLLLPDRQLLSTVIST